MSQAETGLLESVGPISPKRAAIVAAAAEMFLSLGFGAVSMDRIAARAKVSKRTVYSHFENKETLFAAVMGAVCEDIVGGELCPLANEELMATLPTVEMLNQTGVYLLTIIASEMGIELHRLVSAESDRFPELGQTFYENGPGMMIEALRDYLSVKVGAGAFAIDDVGTAAGQFSA
jgi:AcrR family transcriptional regulator